jgi:regulator of nucleoside diphosphate kinase
MMNSQNPYMTEFDLARLRDVLQARISVGRDRDHLDSLEQELDRAHVVDASAIPRDVVTMNSQVRIEDVDTGLESVYTLVFPSDASIAEKRISILAPIGTALLGSRVGATIDWPVPAGRRTVRIKDVLYQPEAAGDYHL